MEYEDKKDKQALIPYEEKPVTVHGAGKVSDGAGEEEAEHLPIYPVRKNRRLRISAIALIRFAAISVAFAAIFFSLFLLGRESAVTDSGGGDDTDIQVGGNVETPPSDTTLPSSDTAPQKEPLFINESMTDADIESLDTDGYSLAHLISSSEDVAVIILHSHNSEKVSENMTVTDAGDALESLLVSAGIRVLHSDKVHDKEGSIGAYGRMKETLSELTREHRGAVCVIDLHDSDSGMPLTLTVGANAEYAWNENLLLAAAFWRNTEEVEGAIKMLPASLGQDNGILTLHLGIGGTDMTDSDARSVISESALALIALLT